jgi:hypothetical protein
MRLDEAILTLARVAAPRTAISRGRPPQWMASQEQASVVTLPRRSRKPFSAAIASAIDLWAETVPGLSGHLRRHHIVVVDAKPRCLKWGALVSSISLAWAKSRSSTVPVIDEFDLRCHLIATVTFAGLDLSPTVTTTVIASPGATPRGISAFTTTTPFTRPGAPPA